MQFAPLLAAVALIWKIVDFAKQVRVRDWNAVITQLVVWFAGVVVIFLLAGTDFADTLKIGGMVLGQLNGSSLVLIGLSFGSGASVAYDFRRAFDNSDSAAQPSLVTGLMPITPPPVVDSDVVRRRDSGEVGLVLILVLLLALVLGGFGFAVHLLWVLAVLALVIFLIGAFAGRGRP